MENNNTNNKPLVISKVRGTDDYFGKDAERLDFMIRELGRFAKNAGFEKVILPSLEFANLYENSLGSASDIIEKQMFAFTDNAKRKVVLKPEGTASFIRAIIQKKDILNDIHVQKQFYYIDKMFRYERPQKGRRREFHQFGLEIVNITEGLVVQTFRIITVSIDILRHFEITNSDYVLKINSIGGIETRERYKEALKKYFLKNISSLSDFSKTRISSNVLRILDSKDETDINFFSRNKIPSITDYLSKFELDNLKSLKKYLEYYKIKYIHDTNLVRGLDYYNDIVFEFVSIEEKFAVIGGGRYDNLISKFDNRKHGAFIGLSLGIERLIMLSKIKIDEMIETEKSKFKSYIIWRSSDKTIYEIGPIIDELVWRHKAEGFGNKLISRDKARIKAVKQGFGYLIMMEDSYLDDKKLTIRDLNTKEEKEVSFDELKTL